MTDTIKLQAAPPIAMRVARVFDASIFIFLLGIMVFAAVPYGTVEPWWEGVFECAIFAVTALWIIEGLLRGSWEIRKLFVVLPLILITAFAFAQAVEWPAALSVLGNRWLTAQHTITIDRYQTILTARKALALTLFLALLLLHISTPKRLSWLVRVVIGLGLGSALFGILRQLLQSTDGFVLPYLFLGVGYGQYIYHNAFSYLMEMVFALLAGLVLGGGVRRDRALIYVAMALFVWAAFVLSNSRGGIVSFMCQSIFLLFVSLTWYSARRVSSGDESRPKWLTILWTSALLRASIILLIVGVLATSILWMGGARLVDRLKEEQEFRQEGPEKARRVDLWNDTWKLIKQHPWTGVGFGAYFLAIPQYQTVSGKLKFEQAHNDYLDLAANGGLIAVGLAGWFMVMVIRRARSSWGSVDAYRRAACFGAMAGILDVAVHSLLDFGLQVTSIAVVFAALVVIAVADGRVEAAPDQRKGTKTVAKNGTISSSRIGKS
ncbi:MAG TPA: O-antigen ligase family protein [Pyrinomonadaceae bacterium]|nr:O-antigen ligase family protein [Pyrinomonadaceae bacterium]